MSYDLFQPLGMGERAPARRIVLPRVRSVALVGAVLFVAVGSALVALRDPPFKPASIEPTIAQPVPDAQPAETVAAAVPPAASPLPTIVRGGENGFTDSGFGTDAGHTGSIRVLQPGSLRQSERFAHIPDNALVESSQFGPLPRRAADGRRPLDVYAGETTGARGTRIALVVGGLGISQSGTQRALAALPKGVTLAFAATGNSLDRWMQEARRGGHELLLQAPMEPFGYPNVSPGAGTLLADDAANGKLDDLRRALGRLTNYVGVMNFMGGRLTGDAAAMEATLGEIGRRGLLFLDDGSSARSVAGDVAEANAVPFARAERLVDASRDPVAIRAELDVLERTARARGTAIGVASAFDATVDTISAWAREAEARGIEIVPVSALASDPEGH